MEWKKPEYSKALVRKAGKAIAENGFSGIEKGEAYKIVNNWRSSHAYPLRSLYSLGKRFGNKYPNAIVVQRLKRLESILAKLNRFPTMGLDRMQDLGGCRIIVNSVKEVNLIVEEFNAANIKNTLIKTNDYIKEPKNDGYRSVHLVFEYKGKQVEYLGMKTELQVRSLLQHSWATSIEALGLKKKVNMKAGEGDDKTLRYMELIAALFAIEENTPLSKSTPQDPWAIFDEAKKLDEETGALKIISAIEMLPTFSGGNKKSNAYYVIRVDAQTGEAKIYSYNHAQFETATDFCAEIEKNNHGAFAVLVSAKDAASLLKAYPNYLADTNLFVQEVDRLYEKYGS